MPFGFKHNNRSRQALNDSAVQGTQSQLQSNASAASSTSSHNFVAEAEPQAFNHQQQPPPPTEAQQAYSASNIVPDIDYRKPAELPTRSQSTRYSTGYHSQSVAPPQSGSSDDLDLNSRRYQQQVQAQSLQAPAVEPKNKKSIFDRMRSGRTSESKPHPQASYNNTTGLARRLSKKENSPIIRTSAPASHRDSGEQSQRADWQYPADSRSHLPSPQEAYNEDALESALEKRAGLQGDGHLHPTIRPVHSESEPSVYNNADDRQKFDAPHLRDQQIHRRPSETSSQNYYQSASHVPQPHLNISPTSLNTGEGYRQQNPETVSQISAYESPTEPQQEQRPASVQSQSGQNPVNHPPVREYPNRTTSIPPSGPRPLSQQLGSMAPPASVSRRAPETKSQSNQGQGQPEARDGPPPNYSRGGFPNPPPTTPGSAPTGSAVPNYRGGPPQRGEQFAAGEQGRSTPPPAPAERDVNDAYKELRMYSITLTCRVKS